MKSFSLSCTSPISIGLSWSASIIFKVDKENIKVISSNDHGVEDQIIKEFSLSSNYRELLLWMFNENKFYLEGDFVDLIITKNLSNFWSDLFSLSWVKDEDSLINDQLPLFLEFNDFELKKIWKSKKEFQRYEFLIQIYNAILFFQKKFGENIKFEDMLKWSNSKSNFDNVLNKIREIEIHEEKLRIEKEELFSKKIKRFENQIQNEMDRWEKNNPFQGGFTQGMHRHQRKIKYRKKIENYIFENDKFPDRDEDS